MPHSVGAVEQPVADNAEGATAAVEALNAGLLATMKAGSSVSFAERFARLDPVIGRVFDLPVLLKGTVGLRWATLSAADQAALLDSFRRFTVSTYVSSFNKFGGEQFTILADRRRVGDLVIVPTTIVPPSGKPARLDYVLHRVGDGDDGAWKIVDILLDGSISQVVVQRSEFHSLVGDDGAARLIAALDHKTAALSGNPS
jgi:phospholipid transport system substrate-binding protein